MNDLGDKIKTLLTNGQLRQKFGQAGLKQVEKIYNWDRHTAELEKMYDSVIIKT